MNFHGFTKKLVGTQASVRLHLTSFPVNALDVACPVFIRAFMKLPKIGDTVDTDWALKLCEHYKLDHLVTRIRENPGAYKSWKFDGVSGVPDNLFAFLAGVDLKILVYQCALPHDLCYGYGESGNEAEKIKADNDFYDNLVRKAKINKRLAKLMRWAVINLGKEEFGFSFSWGFARKK